MNGRDGKTGKEKEDEWKSQYEEDMKILNEKLTEKINSHEEENRREEEQREEKIEIIRKALKEGWGDYVFDDDEDEDDIV